MFKNKVIVITGSSNGIGAGTAVKFAQEGAAAITIHGRQEAALNAVKEKIEKANGQTKVHLVVGDVTDKSVLERLVNETVSKFGKLDILVNNAGFSNPPQPLSQTPITEFDKMFNVNVRSMVILTQLAIPHLIKTKGNIVNTSSVGSIRANALLAFYCMSKTAMDHFTRCLAVELGPKGVRVNAINPGLIPDTDFAAKVGANAEQLEQHVNYVVPRTPLRRVGYVEEIADAIAFVASDKASFITGTCNMVDGGLTLG